MKAAAWERKPESAAPCPSPQPAPYQPQMQKQTAAEPFLESISTITSRARARACPARRLRRHRPTSPARRRGSRAAQARTAAKPWGLAGPGCLPDEYRNFFPGGVGHGPHRQKRQASIPGIIRQGAGLKVQDRVHQPPERPALAELVDDDGSGDHAPSKRRPARPCEPRQHLGQRNWSRGRGQALKFAGRRLIPPESLPQDQAPRGQLRRDRTPEAHRNDRPGLVVFEAGAAAPAARLAPMPVRAATPVLPATSNSHTGRAPARAQAGPHQA